MTDKAIYEMIDNLMPNPYKKNTWYKIECESLPKSYDYYVMKNTHGYLHLDKIKLGSKGVYVERYAFGKGHKLKDLGATIESKDFLDIYKNI